MFLVVVVAFVVVVFVVVVVVIVIVIPYKSETYGEDQHNPVNFAVTILITIVSISSTCSFSLQSGRYN